MRPSCAWTAIGVMAVLLGCGGGGSGDSGGRPGARIWAVGSAVPNQGIVLLSQDLGRSWEVAFRTPELLGGITFLDARHGWIAGGVSVMRTVDGGASFARSEIDPALGGVGDVGFADSMRGVAVGSTPVQIPFFTGFPLVLRSSDGGATWSEVALPGDLRRAGLRAVCLTSDGRGVAAGGGASGPIVLVTADFGASWELVTDRIPGEASGSVSCNDGVLTVVNPGIFRSVDGRTWDDRTPPGRLPVTSPIGATFVGDAGWAVGGGDDVPFVLRTRDAGRTWSEQSLPDDVPGLLATVAAASATDVIAVGFEPRGVATASGGATWESGVFPDEFMRLWDVAIATD